MTDSTAYTDRVLGAVVEAIFKASLTTASDGTRVAALVSRDIIEATLTVQASLLATAPDVASPTALRRYCDEFAKRLYRRTRVAQDDPRLRGVFNRIDVITAEH